MTGSSVLAAFHGSETAVSWCTSFSAPGTSTSSEFVVVVSVVSATSGEESCAAEAVVTVRATAVLTGAACSCLFALDVGNSGEQFLFLVLIGLVDASCCAIVGPDRSS